MYGIERDIKENAKRIDLELSNSLSTERIGTGRLADAMRYSVQNGGKRLRAFLTLEVCRMFGGEDQRALPYALAIEFGHAASLIHDDMPCMDDDDLRRGKPSCHVFFDEYTALLAGDALLSLAFETIVSNPFLDAQTNLIAAKEFSGNVGVKGMCLGQQKDLDGICGSYQELSEIYSLKTGLAIKVSMILGCLAAKKTLDESLHQRISEYSEKVGMAFQIIDDLSDVYSTVEQIGKPVGSDIKNQKITVLSYFSKEEAEKKAASLLDEAAEIFKDYSSSKLICELPCYLKKRMGVRIGELTLSAKALNCFEKVEASQRYDFTKKLIEAYESDKVLEVLQQYGCLEDQKSFEELIDFLHHSKFVQSKRFKDINKSKGIYSQNTIEKNTNTQHYFEQKIVIVGAGVAGATCAFLLKQAGFNVLLYERASLESKSKLCGGILSSKSVKLLDDIFGEEIRKIFKQSMGNACFCSEENSYIDAEKGDYYTVIRKTLDNYILQRYMEIGGEIIDQIDIREIDESSHTITLINRENKKTICCHYDILIAADGANSITRKKVISQHQNTMLALEAVVSPKGNSFIMSPGEIRPGYYGYCWYIPQGDSANIGCGYAKKENGRYYAAEANEMRQKLLDFANRFGIDVSFSAIKGAKLPCADVLLKKDNVFFIGDAAGLIDAHTGEGIYYALVSALLLKDSIVQGRDYEKVMQNITTEISLIDDSREEFYDILSMLIES